MSAGQLLPWPSLKVICNVLRGAVAGLVQHPSREATGHIHVVQKTRSHSACLLHAACSLNLTLQLARSYAELQRRLPVVLVL
ncbi:hypothetical protein TRIATDRAFT_300509, partial [Trichoderma atroviride IMI 206040]